MGRAAREKLPIVPGTRATRCPVGEARMTVDGDLPASWCIHAVGPAFLHSASAAQLEEMDALLASAYQSALSCAAERKLKHVAFSIISGSIFRGPRSLERVLELGLQGIQAGA